MTQLGLAVYGVLELASIPLVWRAHVLLEHSTALAIVGVGGDAESARTADGAFNTMAGFFYLVRAVADIGLVLALVTGLVWLYKSWTFASSRRKQPAMRAGAVVLWSLVPVYGYWRLFGFVSELARRNRVGEQTAHVQRWWFVTAAHVALRLFVSLYPQLGVPEIADSVLAAASVLLGIRMLRALQRAQVNHAKRAGYLADL